jgi:hypothetical protein
MARHTLQQQQQRAAIADAAAELYTSQHCRFGTHLDCTDGTSRPPEPEAGISYQTCVCSCHQGQQ